MKKTTVFLYTALISGIVFLVSSCSKDPKKPGLEYMPDMYRSPSYEVYGSSPLFEDSMAMRTSVPGTIPRGYTFFSYPNTPEGYEAAGRDVKNPMEASPENMEEGKRLYGIYCTHCHGATGQGDGSIVANGKFPPPPSYSAAPSSRGGLMKDLTDGKIFHTITYGINLMGSHASQVNPTERWKIVMYVHQLQHGGSTTTAVTDSSKTTADSTKATAMAK